MEDVMNNYSRLALIVAAFVFAAAVGAYAYNAGVSRGIEQSGKIVVAPVAPAGSTPYPYYYGWRPWGSGFFFAPFFFIFFFFMIARVLFWRGGWYRHGCGYGGGLDEWHRRA